MNDKQRVELAASILDKDKPDWYKLVDLEKLTDLQNPTTCVLGQVYGNWFESNYRLFDEYGMPGVTSCNQYYLEHWRNLIAKRQSGKVPRTIWNLYGLLSK